MTSCLQLLLLPLVLFPVCSFVFCHWTGRQCLRYMFYYIGVNASISVGFISVWGVCRGRWFWDSIMSLNMYNENLVTCWYHSSRRKCVRHWWETLNLPFLSEAVLFSRVPGEHQNLFMGTCGGRSLCCCCCWVIHYLHLKLSPCFLGHCKMCRGPCSEIHSALFFRTAWSQDFPLILGKEQFKNNTITLQLCVCATPSCLLLQCWVISQIYKTFW